MNEPTEIPAAGRRRRRRLLARLLAHIVTKRQDGPADERHRETLDLLFEAAYELREVVLADRDRKRGAVDLPTLDDELRWILGRPNFACHGLAECLRRNGQQIDHKAEHEQAAAIHWMLDLYLKHGAATWRSEAERIMETWRRSAQ